MAWVRRSDGTRIQVTSKSIWGPPPTEQQITDRRLEQAKAECRNRIFAVADEIAQVNLAAAAAGGLLTPEQMTVYRSGLVWIHQMRANCAALAGDHGSDIPSDASWPDIPAGVAKLAAAF